MSVELIFKIIIITILLIFLVWLINKDKNICYDKKPKNIKQKNKYIYNAIIWNTQFPELDSYINYGINTPDINKVSITISGGGVRSFAAAIGYYRALNRLNLSDKIQYVSTSSGGSWFYGLYAFSELQPDILLGKSLKPEDMTLENLETENLDNKQFMGHIFVKKDILEYLIEELFKSKNDIGLAWNNAIGKMILEPYGLNLEKPVSISKEHAKYIKNRNPKLNKPIIQVHKSFWICNTTLCSLEYPHIIIPLTPLYCGVNQKIKNKNKNNNFIGGMLVENYAFGNNIDNNENIIDIVNIGTDNKIKKLSDMIGTSSTAYASILYNTKNDNNFAKYMLPDDIDSLIPSYIINKQNVKLSDGSLADNSGIISLVARGVKRIISFVNTTLNIDDDILLYCETCILPHFGLLSSKCSLESFARNTIQVFKSSDYNDYILPQLLKTLENGGPVFARKSLEVLKNEINGVKGGYFCDILFIVLQPSSKFTEKLSKEIIDEITNHPLKSLKKHGKFNNFPNYEVAFQNLDKGMLNLTLSQINLLSSYTDWCLNQPELKSIVEEMFR